MIRVGLGRAREGTCNGRETVKPSFRIVGARYHFPAVLARKCAYVSRAHDPCDDGIERQIGKLALWIAPTGIRRPRNHRPFVEREVSSRLESGLNPREHSIDRHELLFVTGRS